MGYSKLGFSPDLSSSPPNALCNFTPQTTILTPGKYTIKLTVYDQKGLSNSTTEDFILRKEVITDFFCSIDKWKETSPFIWLKNFLASIFEFL